MASVFDTLEERGYVEQLTHPEEIKKLFEKESVPFYIGIDPMIKKKARSDAKKDGAVLLEPTKDKVTYSDGTTEEVNGFDIPVPALDEEFDVALIGKKGKWYDHKVTVSLLH